MRRIFAIALLYAAAPLGQVMAANPLMENLAALSVAARWCKDYSVDLESPLRLALEKRMNPTKPPHEKEFDAAKTKLELIMAETGVERFCKVTYDRYKPDGPVPGFMMKK